MNYPDYNEFSYSRMEIDKRDALMRDVDFAARHKQEEDPQVDLSEVLQLLPQQAQERLEEAWEKDFAESRTFGDYIKRELARTPDGGFENSDSISDEMLGKTVNKLFKEHNMFVFIKNKAGKTEKKIRGSMNPESSTVLKPANLKKPAWQIKRPMLFLYAFGLGFDAEQTSRLLRDALHTNDFFWKDPEEVIYYWCLKNGYGYDKALEYLALVNEHAGEREKMNPEDESSFDIKQLSAPFREQAAGLASEEEFREYLLTLAPLKKQVSATTIKIFKMNFKDLCEIVTPGLEDTEYEINTGFNTTALFRNLYKDVTPLSELPEELDRFARNIRFPSLWSESGIQKRITGVIPITREDMILCIFLTHAKGCEAEPEASPSIQYDEFMDQVTEDLIACRMGTKEFYPFTPFEKFLVLCLIHEEPFTTFVSFWEKYHAAD